MLRSGGHCDLGEGACVRLCLVFSTFQISPPLRSHGGIHAVHASHSGEFAHFCIQVKFWVRELQENEESCLIYLVETKREFRSKPAWTPHGG